MDNLLMDGFTHYETAQILTVGKWTAISGSGAVTIEAGQGRNGNGALQVYGATPVGGAYTRIRSTLATTDATFVLRWAWAFDEVGAGERSALILYNSEGDQLTLQVNADYSLSLRRGGMGGTVIATSSPDIFTQGSFGAVKFVGTIGNSAACKVYVDNWSVPVISVTSTDLQQQATASWTGIAFAAYGAFGFDENTCRVSDLLVGHGDDSDMPNDITIVTRLPDADGTHSDLTPSTGSDHSALLDEVPPDMADYVVGDTAGQKDTYTFTALGVTGDVHAVQSVAVGQASIAGMRELGMASRIGGSDYVSTGVPVNSSLTGTREIHPVSPDSGLAWTVSEIDAAEFGPQVTA